MGNKCEIHVNSNSEINVTKNVPTSVLQKYLTSVLKDMKNDPRLDDHLAFFQLDVPASTTLRMQWPFTSIYERNLKELIGPSFSTNT